MSVFKTVAEELLEGYPDDEFCIGAMQGAVEGYQESGRIISLIRAFANAARARGTGVSGIIALVEADPERRVTSLDGWHEIKSLLVSEASQG